MKSLRLRLSRVAVIVILILTAVPAEFRNPRQLYWEFLFRIRDAVENILLYMPVGFFLQATRSLASLTGFAAGLSGAVEIAQIFMVRRNPQPMDFVTNVLGALIGGLIGRSFSLRSDSVDLNNAVGTMFTASAVLWAGTYLAVWRMVPPFASRGSVAVTALLLSVGLMSFLKPGHPASKLSVGALAGMIAAAVLLPTSSMSVLWMFSIGIVFGLAGVYCVRS